MKQELHPDQDFQRFLNEGRFMIQRASKSGMFYFPPRVAEPSSGHTDLEWVEASGDASLYSYTVVSQKSPASDYSICIVDLAEGPRVLARLQGVPPREALIGEPLRARIIQEGGKSLLTFELAQEGQL